MCARLFFFFSSQNQKRKVMTSMYLRVCVHICIFYMCTGLARGAVCVCVCARICGLLFVFLLFCVRAAAPVCVFFGLPGPLGPTLTATTTAAKRSLRQCVYCLAVPRMLSILPGFYLWPHTHCRPASTKYFIASCMHTYAYICMLYEPGIFLLFAPFLWLC